MFDVIVIGGGASGLVSSIMASRNGASVCVLERNKSCGKKILVTGNGKCNYYNSDQNIRHYHSSNDNLLGNIINDKNNELVKDFFKSIGVIPRIKNGYYYPYSNQAISVLNTLLTEAKLNGVSIANNVFVLEIVKDNDRFIIKSNNGNYYAKKVIIAAGSYSFYKNMDINSYDIAKSLGHEIIKPLPALVQLVIEDKICKSWAGVRSDALIKLYQDGKFIREESGEVMLTSYGISGICAMQLSGFIARGIDNNRKEEVVINFVPGIAKDLASFINFLDDYSKELNNKNISYILDNILNYKLGNAILSKIKIDGNRNYNNLSYDLKHLLAKSIVEFRVKISKTNSYEDSQVCSGGVSIMDINLESMESKKVKNLYFAGEILDVDGDCGGYNLTFAWISGILAGVNSSKEYLND